jgi:hypothetical protein
MGMLTAANSIIILTDAESIVHAVLSARADELAELLRYR